MKSACRATRRDISEHSCEHQVNINVSTCGGRRLSGPKGQGHDTRKLTSLYSSTHVRCARYLFECSVSGPQMFRPGSVVRERWKNIKYSLDCFSRLFVCLYDSALLSSGCLHRRGSFTILLRIQCPRVRDKRFFLKMINPLGCPTKSEA